MLQLNMLGARPTCVLSSISSQTCLVHSLPGNLCPARPASHSRRHVCRSFEHEDAETSAALNEAAALYSQAEEMARLQTQRDLLQSEMLGREPGAAHAELSNSGYSSSTAAAVEAFWWEQGLSRGTAAKLTAELTSAGRREVSTARLSALLERWSRVLPGMAVAELAAKDSQLLEADVDLAINNLVTMVLQLPGQDLTEILLRQPRLLWCDDLAPRVERTVSHLLKLHPSGDPAVICALIAENPDLLFRMEYYPSATMLDELPIYIQNMMVLSDAGLGFIHRYWKAKATSGIPDKQQWPDASES